MTAFEVFQHSSKELATINQVKQGIKAGHIKEKDLPEDVKARMTKERIDFLLAVQKKSLDTVEEEMKEFSQK